MPPRVPVNRLLFAPAASEAMSEDEAKAYVVEKGRLLMNSTIELFDIEPAAIFDAVCLPVTVSEDIRTQVAQARRMANGGKFALVSATRAFCGLKSDRVAVWHPNDVNLATTPPDPKKAPTPKTSRWTRPVCQDKPEPPDETPF
jgi:hypothetical protein